MTNRIDNLLTEFLGEYVKIITATINSVILESGEIAEAPLIVGGTLLDYDDYFALLQNEEGPELLALSQIVHVSISEPESEDNSFKPKIEDMN